MEEEVVVIVTRRQAAALSPAEAAALSETTAGLVRTFRGPDRFKKARRFLLAIAEVDEG